MNINLEKSENSVAALHQAVQLNNCDLVRSILATDNVDINHQDANGETALMIAASKGFHEIAIILNDCPNLDVLIRRRSDDKTAIEIAEMNGHANIKETLLNNSYLLYAWTLRKTPSAALYLKYLENLNTIRVQQRNVVGQESKTQAFVVPTPEERKMVLARKVWSDVVSETYNQNQKYCQLYDVKAMVVERIKQLGFREKPEQLYEECLSYIKNNSVITVTFMAGLLANNGLSDFQLLNMWEKDNRKMGTYTKLRDRGEKAYFNFLSKSLNKELFDNLYARPRYGELRNFDFAKPVGHANAGYGTSYLSFKDVAKLNALFVPTDSLASIYSGNVYALCTFNNLEILLLQLPNITFETLLSKVHHGSFKQEVDMTTNYIEVMLPAYSILDQNLVECIFVDNNTLKVPEGEIAAFQEFGITVKNTGFYADYAKEFTGAIEQDKLDKVKVLLEEIPSLARLTDSYGRRPVHLAAANGSLMVLKYFADRKFNFLKKAADGVTPLQTAFINNQLGAVNLIIATASAQLGINSNKFLADTSYNFMVLQIAAQYNYSEIVDILIKSGVDVNSQDINGSTAIHCAVENGSAEVLWLLISSGADLSLTNKNHKRADELVIENKENVLCTLLKTYVELIVSGNIEAITDLLSINKSLLKLPLNPLKQTALHLAVVSNQYEVARLLIEETNVDIHEQDSTGQSAILQACQPEVKSHFLSLFLIHGGEAISATNLEQSPLLTLAKQGDHKKISLILAHQQSMLPAIAGSPIKMAAIREAMIASYVRKHYTIAKNISQLCLAVYIYNLKNKKANLALKIRSTIIPRLKLIDNQKYEAACALQDWLDGKIKFKQISQYRDFYLKGQLKLIYQCANCELPNIEEKWVRKYTADRSLESGLEALRERRLPASTDLVKQAQALKEKFFTDSWLDEKLTLVESYLQHPLASLIHNNMDKLDPDARVFLNRCRSSAQIFITQSNRQILLDFFDQTHKLDSPLGNLYKTLSFDQFILRLVNKRYRVIYLDGRLMIARNQDDCLGRELRSIFGKNPRSLLTIIGTPLDKSDIVKEYLALPEMLMSTLVLSQAVSLVIGNGSRDSHRIDLEREYIESIDLGIFSYPAGPEFRDGETLHPDLFFITKPSSPSSTFKNCLNNYKNNKPLIQAANSIYGNNNFSNDLRDSIDTVKLENFSFSKSAYIKRMKNTLITLLLAVDKTAAEWQLGRTYNLKGLGLGAFGFSSGNEILEDFFITALYTTLREVKLAHLRCINLINFPSDIDDHGIATLYSPQKLRDMPSVGEITVIRSIMQPNSNQCKGTALDFCGTPFCGDSASLVGNEGQIGMTRSSSDDPAQLYSLLDPAIFDVSVNKSWQQATSIVYLNNNAPFIDNESETLDEKDLSSNSSTGISR